MSALARSALLAVVAVTAAGCSVFGGKAAEEPAYTMERQEGAFEIRAYPGLVVARTTAPGDRDAATSEGFMRLFDYITGENGGAREIEMTAPVIASQGAETTEGAEIAMTAPVIGTPVRGGAETPDPDAAGAEIAMTAPVIGTPADAAAGWQIAFVLPEGVTAETAPRPTDPSVEIATLPERRLA
ncbi:MAG: heme-binding protein, partial [Pseudomonadota bacterium]